MKYALKCVVVLALLVAVALPSLAAEDAPKKKRKPNPAAQAARAGERQVAALMKKLKDGGVELSEEQQKKIKDVASEFGPKLQQAQAAVREAGGGREVAQKRAAVAKKLRAEGLKGKALQEAVLKELNLGPEAEEAMKKAQAQAQEVNQAFMTAIRGVLTEEQIEKAGLAKKRAKPGAAKREARKQKAKGDKAKLPGNPKSETAGEKKAD